MILPHDTIRGAERQAADGAVRGDQPIEGIARPGQLDGATDQWNQRDLVDDEPRIFGKGVGELRILDFDPTDLRQVLNLQK
jgi:hypothetical protein